MAGFIDLGPIQCNNPECSQNIEKFLNDLKIFTPGHPKNQVYSSIPVIYSCFPSSNYQKNFSGSYWKSMQLIFLFLPTAPTIMYSCILKSLTQAELNGYLYDITDILNLYLNGSEICFKLENLRKNEICVDKKCHGYEDGATCDHDLKAADKIFDKIFESNSCESRIIGVVESLLSVKEKIMVYPKRQNIIEALQKINKKCLIRGCAERVLLGLGYLRLSEIEDYSKLERNHITHLSYEVILDVTKDLIAKQKDFGILLDVSIEILKNGYIPKDLKLIENIIKSTDFHLFAWVYISNYFSTDLRRYILNLDSWLEKIETFDKKTKNNNQKPRCSIKITNYENLKNCEFGTLIIDAIMNKNPKIISFFRGLTGLDVFSLCEDSDNIKDFLCFSEKIPASTLSQIIDLFKKNHILQNFPALYYGSDLIKTYEVLTILPYFAMRDEYSKVCKHVNKIFSFLIGNSFDTPSADVCPGLKFLLQSIVKALTRLIGVLLFQQKPKTETEFYIGFEEFCHLCGSFSKSFCDTCFTRKIPVLVPKFIYEADPDFEVYFSKVFKTGSSSFSKSLKEKFDLFIKSCSEKVAFSIEKHDCLEDIKDLSLYISCLVLKYNQQYISTDLELNLFTCSIVQPTRLLTKENEDYLTDKLLLSKLLSLRRLETEKIKSINIKDLTLICKIVLWPSPLPQLQQITESCIRVLKKKYDFSIEDLLSCIKDEDLGEWAEQVSNTIDYLKFLLNIQSFSLDNYFLPKIQLEIIIKHDSKKSFFILKRFFNEYQKPFMNINYTYIISGIAWKNREDKISDFEGLCSKMTGKNYNERTTLQDLAEISSISISLLRETSHIFLLAQLGLGTTSNEWQLLSKMQMTQTCVSDSEIEKFFKAYSVIEKVFNTTDCLSQNIGFFSKFGWSDFFQLAKNAEIYKMPSKKYNVDAQIGISKLCFYYNSLEENVDYLSTKIIGICGFFLETDIELMLQILEKFVYEFDIEDHRAAVLALAFIGRDHKRGRSIISEVLSRQSEEELIHLESIYFMLYYNESDCLDKLKSLQNEKSISSALFDSLLKAICEYFPLVQYAAVSIIPYLIDSGYSLNYEHLILSLNKANSSLAARHHTGELPFQLGMKIDKSLGLVGAYYSNVSYKIAVLGVSDSVPFNNFYSNCERIYLAEKKLKNKEDETVGILENVFCAAVKKTGEVSWSEARSLREWTEILIYSFKMKEYYHIVPLLHVNLDILLDVLPKIFIKNSEKVEYFIRYLKDFFRNSSAVSKRFMIKVIDKCEFIKRGLSPIDMINEYIQLDEYPRALLLLEQTIRSRISKLDIKYEPKLISPEELELCKKVYQGLLSSRYLNAIPEICKSKDEEKKTLKKMLRSGFYSSFFVSGLDEEMTIAAAWRIGKPIEVKLSTDIERCIAYVLNQEDKISAVEKVRDFLNLLSWKRSADFCQAYEHILTQHLLENITGIISQKYSYSDIKKRNSVIQDKFRYHEMALRINYILYKKMENSKLIIYTICDIFKLACFYQEYEYCKNFLNDTVIIDNIRVRYPIVYRYNYCKLMYHLGQVDGKIIKTLEEIYFFLPFDNEAHLKLGKYTNIQLKYKIAVLIIKALLPTVHYKELLKYLPVRNNFYMNHRLSLEKGFAVLADKLYESCFSDNKISHQVAIETCELYIESLKHGHNLYLNSSTRLLRLFFCLCEDRQEGSLAKKMQDLAENLPLFIWADRVNQLISASLTFSEPCRLFISIIFTRLLAKHPSHMYWFLCPYIIEDELNAKDKLIKKEKQSNRAYLFKSILDKHLGSSNKRPKLFDFFKDLINLCMKKELKFVSPKINENLVDLVFPCYENFKVKEYSKRLNLWKTETEGFSENPVLMRKIESELVRYHTKSQPCKVAVQCSDGKKRYFICKFEKGSDMRKESRVSQIIQYTNKQFLKDPECKRLNIRLPTYNIVYIGSNCGLVEYVEGNTTVKQIINNFKPYKPNIIAQSLTENEWNEISTKIRPVLHKHFTEKYKEPNDWLWAVNNFTRSLAAWSMFGYLIGLGDRHTENIMLNEETGELLFIDFESIFDYACMLRVPECVPFRLTPEIQSALGLFFEQGEFTKTCVKVLKCLKKNSLSLMIQFECFVTDPLSCAIINPEINKSDINPKNTLEIVYSRLKGVKNYKKQDKFESHKKQVEEIISNATNPKNLNKMFTGWAPWQ